MYVLLIDRHQVEIVRLLPVSGVGHGLDGVGVDHQLDGRVERLSLPLSPSLDGPGQAFVSALVQIR